MIVIVVMVVTMMIVFMIVLVAHGSNYRLLADCGPLPCAFGANGVGSPAPLSKLNGGVFWSKINVDFVFNDASSAFNCRRKTASSG